ncbi:hypothetical protein JOE65_001933 [Arthrobacter roseus]|nr:hypothetical protein [Arthrobacter roseus]
MSDNQYDDLSGDGAITGTLFGMTQLLIGYARCSTDQQDLTAQRDALTKLGVIFRSRLHTLPRNSGVVQTSMDTEVSEVPCANRHFSEVDCTNQ